MINLLERNLLTATSQYRIGISPLITTVLATALLSFVLSAAAIAAETAREDAGDTQESNGQVTLPLEEYQRLLRQAEIQPLPAPSGYATGQSVIDAIFHQRDGRVTATVSARVEVETFKDEWTLVALLGPGAALESALINGAPVQLVQRAEGLFWLSEKRQKVTIALTYHVDSRFFDRSFVTSLPIPGAAATRFTMQIPQIHIDLAVSPSSNLIIEESGTNTTATGTIPGARVMMVSWRVVTDREYILSRAEYSGIVQTSQHPPDSGGSIGWNAGIDAEVLIDGEVTVPLISTTTALIAVNVNGEPATVFNEQGRFAVRLSGSGEHRIDLSFLSPVSFSDGVPSAAFDIPRVPVSRFELTLKGDKLVRASTLNAGKNTGEWGAVANLEIDSNEGSTIATFFIPLSTRLSLNWMEAIPEDIAVEKRANAVVYQALHATEGVMYGLASIRYEITRGETSLLEFAIPSGAQVNNVTSQASAVADWVVVEPENNPGGEKSLNQEMAVIRVFLNRAVSGEFILSVAYEQLLERHPAMGSADPAVDSSSFTVPVLRAVNVSRQKGMIALLSGDDLALAPLEFAGMSEVGENQLPAFFRNQLQQTVSHTFKYHYETARLAVNAVTPERQQGKFNAQIDTLISIGEVTLQGQVSIESDIKSGVLRELSLKLPEDVNILGVSGPSIRTHTVTVEGDRQVVAIEFTRDMDGQFRIELNFERIMLDGTAETNVPRIEVVGADVAHGRIAIEALSALEVLASRIEHLSTLEINELPRQLVLKTTNPILLAYRYAGTDKPFALQLKITRHEEIEVQVAAIDAANYKTLFTSDGLAVTRVQFDVRNSRRQFLRLSLPPGSEIWSVFVNGNAQKPAFAADSKAGSKDVLIKMVNSANAFPVELVYATRGDAMNNFGSIKSSLPRPDMIVTRTNWDVYVPASPRYGRPGTNMEILASSVMTTIQDASLEVLRGAVADVINGEPLHMELPTQGLLYRFAKLYANQSDEDAHFTLPYVNRSAGFAGLWISLLGTFIAWSGIILLGIIHKGYALDIPGGEKWFDLPAYLPWLLISLGSVLAGLSIVLLGAPILLPSALSIFLGVVLLGYVSWKSRV